MTTQILQADQSEDSPLPSERQLRVLFVAEAFGGGLFEITRHIAEGLAERGHRVVIAYGVRPETPADPESRVDPRVELIPMPWTDRRLRSQVQGLRALKKVVDEVDPDVVHLMSSYAGFHGALACGRRFPTVYTPQGYAFTMRSKPRGLRMVFRVLEFFVARRVSLVGACSHSEARHAREGVRAPRVAIVENGIAELDDPQGAGDRDLHPRVAGLGRPSPQRRPDACARILSAVSDVAAVEWIGGGPRSEGLEALERHGVPVTGWLTHAETQTRLAATDVYLHWTAWDGLPLSVLEALAYDVLVVASDIGPNREILGDRQVCATEQEAIALIRSVLSDSALRQGLLAEQRRRRQRYAASVMVERWIALYAGLARSSDVRTAPPSRLGAVVVHDDR